MSNKLMFGPVKTHQAQEDNSEGAHVTIPVRTHGDYYATDEGKYAILGAKASLAQAISDGVLPRNAVIEQLDPDTLNIKVPCDTWEAIMKIGSELTEQIPIVTGAKYTEVIVQSRAL